MEDLKSLLDQIKKQRTKLYHILNFNLSEARANELVQITGSYIYALVQTGNVSIILNELEGDSIDLLKFRAIKAPFYRFFLTNTAQPATSIKLAIGVISEDFEIDDSGASILGGVITEAVAPTLYNDICTAAATEYSRSLNECRKFLIKARGGQLKVCFTSGQSGTTFILLNDGQGYNEDMIRPTSLVLYFQSPTAGAIAEIIKWL